MTQQQPTTETTNKILAGLTLRTQDGFLLTPESVAPGQKEIMECILNRQAPTGQRKVHVMAHTRYGKSIIVGAAVAIRAAIKKERWSIIAPTKDQAQIIMDYVIHFAMHDPIISSLLATSVKTLKAEHLTQRRKRDHITFLSGGEVRTYSSGQTMGFGAPNIVLDEAGLVSDSDESKVFRMLGDNPNDFFIMKIGNPWENNHFNRSYLDDTYYHINIDSDRGLTEGRLTYAILDEQRGKPNFDILYNNIFPDAAARDKYGYLPLLTHKQIMAAQVQPSTIIPFGDRLTGVDPSDEGANEGVIVSRFTNIAMMDKASSSLNPVSIADETARIPAVRYYVDKQGVGSGTVRLLLMGQDTRSKTVPINAGEKLTEKELPSNVNPREFLNQRAYIFWQLKLWVEGGGKLVADERWGKQLGAIKYKNSGPALQIIPKELLRNEYYNVHDLGAADALSFTFSPLRPKVFLNQHTSGGIQHAYYPDMGI